MLRTGKVTGWEQGQFEGGGLQPRLCLLRIAPDWLLTQEVLKKRAWLTAFLSSRLWKSDILFWNQLESKS